MNAHKLHPFLLHFAFLLSSVFLFSSCVKDQLTQRTSYKVNEPQYMSFEKLRTSINLEAPRELVEPGKIYYINNYLLINERMQGIHIIDNSNPSIPNNIGFLTIPGNVDMAVKNMVLYADSYVDMVALDISGLPNVTEVKRIEDVFSYQYFSHNQYNPAYSSEQVDQSRGVVVGWKVKDVVDVCENDDCQEEYVNYQTSFADDNSIGTTGIPEAGGRTFSSPNSVGTTTGTGGSMARFTIVDNVLYTIVNSAVIKPFDITVCADPIAHENVQVGWNIETLFPFGDYLFIGSETGMFIYDISAPLVPTYVSQFDHARACDPVVVYGDYAYVTLRSNGACWGTDNQLDVINISDIENPKLVKTYQMEQPYGLGINGPEDVLFICDGDAGLKVYNVADKLAIDENQISHFPGINAFDVIPLNNVLLMIGSDGLYQYDYSDLNNIREMSVIPVAINAVLE